MRKVNKRYLIAGLGLIVISNIAVLASVAYNRSGEPDSVVRLSERELNLPYRYGLERENSGLYLSPQWRVYDPDSQRHSFSAYPDWLDHAKLKSLGFDVSRDPADNDAWYHYRHVLPREVILVIEFNGDAHATLLARLRTILQDAEQELAADPDNSTLVHQVEQARKNLSSELNHNSRLFIVDAGLDRQALRKRYPDRHRYILARGEVRLRHVKPSHRDAYLTGQISKLSNDEIHVPLRFRRALIKDVRESRAGRVYRTPEPKFVAEIAYGKRLEPWLVEIRNTARR